MIRTTLGQPLFYPWHWYRFHISNFQTSLNFRKISYLASKSLFLECLDNGHLGLSLIFWYNWIVLKASEGHSVESDFFIVNLIFLVYIVAGFSFFHLYLLRNFRIIFKCIDFMKFFMKKF